MITLYFWPTANGYKPLILLEELGLPYALAPINIFRDEQRSPVFLEISPNGRIPALVDDDAGQAGPVRIFESGAILTYLARKGGRFLPAGASEQSETLQWLFWQIGGLGPMMGQFAHFLHLASENNPYGLKRYGDETRRLFGVLEARLSSRDFLANDYSIADIATYPWVIFAPRMGMSLDDYPHLDAWRQRIGARPAVQRAYEKGSPIGKDQPLDDAARLSLLGGKRAEKAS